MESGQLDETKLSPHKSTGRDEAGSTHINYTRQSWVHPHQLDEMKLGPPTSTIRDEAGSTHINWTR